jgi:hypothetical protein
MTGREFVTAFAGELGIADLDDATIDALLSLASVAAHGSERLAAPLACFLVGMAGGDVGRGVAAAHAVIAAAGS